MAEAEKIALSDVALNYIKPLYGSHKVGEAFDGRELPADPNRDSIIDELKAKGVATRGGGRFWKMTLVVPVTQLTGGGDSAPPRKARGAGTGTRGRRAGATPPDTRGMVQIPKAALPLDHAKVTEFIHAVRGDAQREFERRKQDGLTDVEFAKATKGLKGTALRQKMRELDAQFDLDFEAFIRGQFPSELVMILGIPAAGPDTPDQKPRGAR